MKKKALLLAHLLACRACLWAALGLFAALALGPPRAQAAVTEAWVHRYNNVVSNLNGQAVMVVSDAAGDIIVTGTTDGGTTGQDMLTVKYSGVDGSVLWQQRYNGAANSYDSPSALAIDGSGNVVVTGVSNARFTLDEELVGGEYYTAKYAAADGALLWDKRYNGLENIFDRAQAVAVDGSGNVVVTGVSDGDDYTAKYAAADGALLWEQRYNGPANSDDRAYAMAVDGGGNVVVTGYSVGTNFNAHYYTAKYAAADGTPLWEQRYSGPANGHDYANAAAVDGNGNAIVTGYSWGSGNDTDYYTAKYAAADGALLWEKRYTNGSASAVAVDGSGNVVVTGYSWGSGNDTDYYTAKYAAVDDALLWEKRYNSPANNYDGAIAVAVDGSGNVVVTGSSYNGTNEDYYTGKYAAADGALLWEKRYNGPENSYDYASAVAVDGSGNVVVTGTSQGGYYTAKYAAADGALLWEKRYNGPDNGDDTVAWGHGLAIGPNGMVAVTGTSSGDYATLVYRDDVYPISIALVPAGVRLRFVGIPGRSYSIERAPAVTGPWSIINTQAAPASGLLEYLDAATPPGSAFYRTVQP